MNWTTRRLPLGGLPYPEAYLFEDWSSETDRIRWFHAVSCNCVRELALSVNPSGLQLVGLGL